MLLSDMHFHLDCFRNHQDIYNQINSLKQYTLCVTNSPAIFRACKSTYDETKYVRFALGAHPLSVDRDFNALEFELLAKGTRYIGEIGLDFSRVSLNARDKQINKFCEICDILSNGHRIISVHSLRAESLTYEILSRHINKNKIIMHWFCGDISIMRKFVDIGCFFSLNIGQLKNHIDVVKAIPIDRILIESDAPLGAYKQDDYTPQKLVELYKTFSNILNFDVTTQVYENMKNILS